jgi:hypothetical protein
VTLEQQAHEQLGALSNAETKVLRAVVQGELAICSPIAKEPSASESDPRGANQWGRERAIRAKLLRWICVDESTKEVIDPYGPRVSGARIEGRLSLPFVKLNFPLQFTSCWFPQGLSLSGSELPELRLDRTRFGLFPAAAGDGYSPALVANLIQVRGTVHLDNGFLAEGRVDLSGAIIGGNLLCEKSHFENPGDVALSVAYAAVGGSVLLRNDFLAEGEVDLFNAQIGGALDCKGSKFLNAVGRALHANRAKIGGWASTPRQQSQNRG